jgi:hypothetical protein
VIAGPPNTMVMPEYGIDQGTRSPPVTKTCSVEEGRASVDDAVLGFGWAVIHPCADHVAALG